MILLTTADGLLRRAVEFAARPDEAVVADPEGVQSALLHGWARAHVWDERLGRAPLRSAGVPVVPVPESQMWHWGSAHRRSGAPLDPAIQLAAPVAHLLAAHALEATWVDFLLADLARASGGPLPLGFRAFARHALECPARYTELAEIGEVGGLTPGALKARFRRRELESPYTYLRWLRSLAVAELLSDTHVRVAEAAARLGFTSDTNMCRMVKVATGATPGALRDPGARRRLRVAFARALLTPAARRAWAELDAVFGRVRAA